MIIRRIAILLLVLLPPRPVRGPGKGFCTLGADFFFAFTHYPPGGGGKIYKNLFFSDFFLI